MSELGDNISALLKLLIGKDGWIIWTAASIVSWWIFTADRILIFFYIALFCSIVILLKIGNAIYNSFIKLRAKHLARIEVEQIEAKRVNDIRKKELFYNKIIWQHFYIADKTLVIYFQLYEITPYVVGLPMFPISVFDLADIIDESGPLGRLATNG